MKPKWTRKVPAISAVMTPFPFSIDVDANLEQAAEMIRERGVRHLPVLDGVEPVGVVTDRDVRRALRRRRDADPAPRVRDLCDREAFVVEMGVSLDEVLRYMAQRHVEAAMVIKEGRLAGIFTLTDACRSFAEYLSARPEGDDDDVA